MKALMLAAALAAPNPATPRACLTDADAQAVALVAMPEIIRETGVVCATRLPADSLVRRTSGPFIAKYDAAADEAWPTARAAITRMIDPMADVLLQSQYARPVLTSLLVPQLVGRIEPADCGTLDRLVTLLAPLPPRNTAGVIVTALAYFKAERAKGKNVTVPDLPLCPGVGQ